MIYTKRRLPLNTFSYMALLIGWCLISYLIVWIEKYRDREQFQDDIELILDNKASVCDFVKTSVVGNISSVKLKPRLQFNNTSEGIEMIEQDGHSLIAGNRLLMMKPEFSNIKQNTSEGIDENIIGYQRSKYNTELARWNELKQLVDYFECTSGGFSVLKLQKRVTGFDIVEYESGDLGYKVPELRWIPGVDNGFGYIIPGRSIPTNRLSLDKAYEDAMEYIASEEGGSNRVGGAYSSLINLPLKRSKYHYNDNSEPVRIDALPNSTKSWEIKNQLIFNPVYVVWYNIRGTHYEIVEDKKATFNNWILYFLIGALVISGIFWFARLRKQD